MIILALDQAEYKIGVALGEAGAFPKVWTYGLRTKKERTENAVERYACWLHTMITSNDVDLVCTEHFIPLGAMRGRTNAASHEGQIGLGYAARAVSAVCAVHFRSPHIATIRTHFLGSRGVLGDSPATKLMVVARAQQLGYIPRDCDDDDMADACAVFDFASSHFARKAAKFALT